MGIGAAILGGGLISGIAGLGSAAIGGNAAQNAANTAAQTQLTMYNQTRQDLLPFMSGGASAFNQLGAMYGFGPGGSGGPSASAAMAQLSQFPGYQFGLQQGGQALDRSAASQGLLLSGAQLKASQQFGTNYALQQGWAPYISGLQSAAQLGENAGAQVGAQGTVAAGNAGAAQLAGGQAASNEAASIGNILQGSAYLPYMSMNQGALAGGMPNAGMANPYDSSGDYTMDFLT